MRNLFRTWPGQSIVFKIHKGYLYILSNQSEVAAVPTTGKRLINDDDGNSYYQCYWFPVDDLTIDRARDPEDPRAFNPTPSMMNMIRIWRPNPRAEPDLKTS